jgi:two-component sensor histidine kinase
MTGSAYPKDFTTIHMDGNLGLELVHTLVDQLDGKLDRTLAIGVAYLLTFERIKQTGSWRRRTSS